MEKNSKTYLLPSLSIIIGMLFFGLISSLQVSGSVASNVTVISNITLNETTTVSEGSWDKIALDKGNITGEEQGKEVIIKSDKFPYEILIYAGIFIIVIFCIFAIIIDRERHHRRK